MLHKCSVTAVARHPWCSVWATKLLSAKAAKQGDEDQNWSVFTCSAPQPSLLDNINTPHQWIYRHKNFSQQEEVWFGVCESKRSLRRWRTTLNLKARKTLSVFWQPFPFVRHAFSPVVLHFFSRIPTEQNLYYKNLGLYYGLASGTLPLYSRLCLGVKGGCVSCNSPT